MKRFISVLLLLHVVALHTSIAAMEILSWLIFVCIVGWKIRTRSRFEFPLWLPVVGLVGAVGISLALSPALKPFWMQFGFMRWVFLMWSFAWALSLVWDEQFESRLIKVWIFAFFAAGAYSAVQCLTGIDPLHSRQVVFPQDANLFKATGFFSFSLTYAYAIGVSFFAIALPSLKKGRLLGGLVILMGAVALLASMSKGAWLAAAATGLLYLAFVRPVLVPIFLAGLGGAAALLMSLSPVFQDKLGRMLHFNPDRSASVRIDIWQGYWEMFKDHPFFGIGLFQGDKLLPEMYQRLGITQEFVSHAHNVPLQWAAGAGILALVFYIWICVSQLKSSWQLRGVWTWGWPLVLAQVFWQLGSLTEANFFDGEVNHVIVFVWALIFAGNSLKSKKADS